MIDAVTVGTGSTRILDANVTRLRRRVNFVNNSDEDMYLCPGGLAVATEGICLKAAGGSLSDQPDATGYMYQGVWTAECLSGGKVISVTELQVGN